MIAYEGVLKCLHRCVAEYCKMQMIHAKNASSNNQMIMKKSEQLKYIDEFIFDRLDKEELRYLVYQLLEDESLLRNFRLYTSMKGAFV